MSTWENAMLCDIHVETLSGRKEKILENLSIINVAQFLGDGKVAIA